MTDLELFTAILDVCGVETMRVSNDTETFVGHFGRSASFWSSFNTATGVMTWHAINPMRRFIDTGAIA